MACKQSWAPDAIQLATNTCIPCELHCVTSSYECRSSDYLYQLEVARHKPNPEILSRHGSAPNAATAIARLVAWAPARAVRCDPGVSRRRRSVLTPEFDRMIESNITLYSTCRVHAKHYEQFAYRCYSETLPLRHIPMVPKKTIVHLGVKLRYSDQCPQGLL
jgi:hypothetical protein